MFLIETQDIYYHEFDDNEDGEIFGYYLNTAVIEKYDPWNRIETDNKSFEFNLQSKK